MELGHGALRRDNINTLNSALHPKHGLAWTDGQAIYLCTDPLDNFTRNTASVKLGAFDGVSSLQWSTDIDVEGNINRSPSQAQTTFCYLCVVYTNSISIWTVQGHAPDLSLKHVRKINASPIAQGCLWNPRRDILCVLKSSQCCFYFRHSTNKGSYSFPVIDSSRITCGCWSQDGKRLVVGVGEIILVYHWNDIDKSISEYHITAWKIPNAEGAIRSLVSISDHQMACTTELPLEQICKAETKNLFETPELNSSSDSDGRPSPWDSLGSNSEVMGGPRSSHLDNLFNLKINALRVLSSASSQLLVFAIPKSGVEPPSKMASESLPEVLVPDLLHYDSALEVLLVGSNTLSFLLVFRLHGHQLVKIHKIQLGENHRLKGLCSLPGTAVEGVLAMVGKQAPQNLAFLFPALNVDYDLSLRVIPLGKAQVESLPASPSKPGAPLRRSAADIPANLFKEIELSNGNSRVHLLRFNSLYSDQHVVQENENKEPEKKEEEEEEEEEFNLLMPDSDVKDSVHASKVSDPLIFDDIPSSSRSVPLQIETVEFSASKPDFDNNVNQYTNACYENIALKQVTCKEAPHGPTSNDLSSGSIKGATESSSLGALENATQEQRPQVPAIEQQIQHQGTQIRHLQQRIDEISRLLDETMQSDYKPAHAPDLVHLVYRRDLNECDGDADANEVKKTFVINSNRLQMDAVKMAFGLLTVELYVGNVPCVLSGNPAGYIPLLFTPNETYFITGQRIVNTTSTYC